MNKTSSARATSICPNCGEEFWYYKSSYPNGKIHCSRECRSEAVRTTGICPTCGEEFQYRKSWPRKYCSRACQMEDTKHNLGEYYNPIEEPIYCEQCGSEIVENRHRKRRFCSLDCFGKWLSENNSGENSPRYNQVERTCKQCDETFLIQPAQLKYGYGVFCSNACKHIYFSEHPINPNPDLPVMYGPENPRWRGGYDPYYGPDWYQQRNKARKRDNYTCQRCGATEDELPEQLSVHHIVAFREFGIEQYKQANALSNLISLCRGCHTVVENGVGLDV